MKIRRLKTKYFLAFRDNTSDLIAGEIFKDILGYEGLYQISNYGRVKSTNYNSHNRIIKATLTNRKTLKVTLHRKFVKKQFHIPLLVGNTFHESFTITHIPDEIWRPVRGYEGLYEVSNFGRVKRVEGAFNDWLLSVAVSSHGYPVAVLIRNKIKKSVRVHRLVAEGFIENPENKKCVNHKDGVKTNNVWTNLEWNTSSENNKHAFSIGLKKTDPLTIWTRKLSPDAVKSIRLLSSSGISNKSIADRFNITSSYVNEIIKFRAWKNV